MSIVAAASNGKEAIEVFRAVRPDVTLMDLMLPDLSGVARRDMAHDLHFALAERFIAEMLCEPGSLSRNVEARGPERMFWSIGIISEGINSLEAERTKTTTLEIERPREMMAFTDRLCGSHAESAPVRMVCGPAG
jgi:hypothetical protein